MTRPAETPKPDQDAGPIAALMSKVEYDTNGGCWLWSGARNSRGYGRLAIAKRRVAAHRIMYECVRGPIPDGLVCDHLCRVTCCINPMHIEPVTNHENTLRGVSPVAGNMTKTHCTKGHPFDDLNTLFGARKYGATRDCRICSHERSVRAREARKNRNPRHDGLLVRFTPDEDALILRLALEGHGPTETIALARAITGISRCANTYRIRLRTLRAHALRSLETEGET